MPDYRELTQAEISTVAAELAELDRYNDYIAFAKKHFGDKAHKITVEFESEYNDEGGSYMSPSGVTVEDAEGEQIELEDEADDTMRDDMYNLDAGEDDYEVVYIEGQVPKLKYGKVYVLA